MSNSSQTSENNDQNSSEYSSDLTQMHEDEQQTLNLKKLEEKLKLTFDYEINSVKPDNSNNLNCKMYYYDLNQKKFRIINYNSFKDKLLPLIKIPNELHPNKYDSEFEEIEEKPLPKNIKTANCLKRLVSKQKRRFQNEYFDLDMAYITDHVIAMGFPSTGCETFYRNSLKDVVKFFHFYHNDNVKIYNLCLEKDRIYDKNIFNKFQVGLFPATDHNPCPIKLILEFCIDICLYLIKNPEGIAAVHCKAGKGRTGVMICSYLIFSRLCETSEKAFRYYARIRTKDNTGVTIPSQKRYIKYFETFLEANFYPPYIFLIPKIIKYHFGHTFNKNGRPHVNNILQSFKKEKSYFISANKFKLQGVRVGPLPKGKNLSLKICNFVNNNFDIDNDRLDEMDDDDENSINNNNDDNYVYYEIFFHPELIIHSDIKISITGGVNFYVWVNLWYSSWETIKDFYDTSIKTNEVGNKKDINNNNIDSNNIYNGNINYYYESNIYNFNNNNNNNYSLNNSNNEKSNEDNNNNNFSNFDSANSNNDLNNNTNINNDFSVKNEDDASVNSNKRLSIEKKLTNKLSKNMLTNLSSENGDCNNEKSLYEIIFKMKHNTNLNELINKINLNSKTQLNRNKLKIILGKEELDKFEEKKKIKDISIIIYYSLIESE